MRVFSFFSYATLLLLALAAAIVMAGGPGEFWARVTGDEPEPAPAPQTRVGRAFGTGGASEQADRVIRDMEAMDELSRSVGR